MIEPLPNCFSICASAAARALLLLSSMGSESRGMSVSLRSIARRPAAGKAGRTPVRSWHRTIVRCKPSEWPSPMRRLEWPIARPIALASRRSSPRSARRPTPRARPPGRPGSAGWRPSSAVPRAPSAKQTIPTGLAAVPPAGPGDAGDRDREVRAAARAARPSAIAARRRLADTAPCARQRLRRARRASPSWLRSNR